MIHLKEPTYFSYQQHVSGLNGNCSFNLASTSHPHPTPITPVSRAPSSICKKRKRQSSESGLLHLLKNIIHLAELNKLLPDESNPTIGVC